MSRQLLALSVWADLRDGGARAQLLLAVAPRLGLRRVVIPTAGVLAGSGEEAASLAARAPAGVDVVLRDPTASGVSTVAGTTWIPTWPERELDVELARADQGSLVVDVPVSVGRTNAEAAARAASDELFAVTGSPHLQGVFGRLEDAQQRVAWLAAAGVGELCCMLPATDLLDHLAQLTAVNVGHLDTHAPGSGRSPDPAPPPGWGGRAWSPPEADVGVDAPRGLEQLG